MRPSGWGEPPDGIQDIKGRAVRIRFEGLNTVEARASGAHIGPWGKNC